MNRDSELVQNMTGLIYPFIILFGLYIILNGHNSPGGGFQGGAVLASVFISRYLVDDKLKMKISTLQKLEKILFLAILAIVILFAFRSNHQAVKEWNTVYLITLNLLIGIKVCCGLLVIFFRFAYWEDVD